MTLPGGWGALEEKQNQIGTKMVRCVNICTPATQGVYMVATPAEEVPKWAAQQKEELMQWMESQVENRVEGKLSPQPGFGSRGSVWRARTSRGRRAGRRAGGPGAWEMYRLGDVVKHHGVPKKWEPVRGVGAD